MSIAPSEPRHSQNIAAASDADHPVRSAGERPVKRTKRRKRSTSHLKAVPETLALREQIKAEAERFAEPLDKSRPFTKDELERHGRALLAQMELPEKYLGFTMVMIGNFFWKRQLMAVPFERRMLLLPHCLKHAEGCPAEYDEFGLDCERCGACSIADYKLRAEELGYKVLIAEGSPIVLKIIVSGYIDGILGVACLNVLEKAIDKVLLAGVPSYAVPLHSGDCTNTTLDESWVWDLLDKYEPLPSPQTSSYVPLMRRANRLFTEEFDRLVPRVRSKAGIVRGSTDAASPVDRSGDRATAELSPLAQTEHISYEWLTNGGKRFRPFITLAAYDALTGAKGLTAGTDDKALVSDDVRRVAMAIEAFHKASLVHDDIEDDDRFRYGEETLHRRYDLGTAINVGDYLIGLGYRLVNSARAGLGAEAVSDILERMSAAHVKLCDGQGAEMAWQAAANRDITPLDALQIYALKTAPAFEAALYAGLRMAGPVDRYEEMIPAFAKHLGVGFQVLNDLKDWQGDDHNKLVAGQDAMSFRPTVLLALARQAAADEQRRDLEQLFTSDQPETLRFGRLRELFETLGTFDTARALVEKSRARAEALADEVEPDELRQLLYFLVDTVLASESDDAHPEEPALVPLSVAGPAES